MIRTMINGFCMALADSVPGVSGGTIALILGFYDKFIGSINQVFYGKKEEKKEGLIYLIKLLLGWALGMILAVLVLTKFLRPIFMPCRPCSWASFSPLSLSLQRKSTPVSRKSGNTRPLLSLALPLWRR